MRVGERTQLGSSGALGLVAVTLSLSMVLGVAASARAQFAEQWDPPAAPSPVATRRPLRAHTPRPLGERIAIQLVPTLPLLALAVGAEHATLDGLRRPCSGGLGHCIGNALGNRGAIVIVPVGFSVLSALVLSVIADEARTGTIVGLSIGRSSGLS